MSQIDLVSDAEDQSAHAEQSERILVLAPTGDDAAVAAAILSEHGLTAVHVSDLRSLADEVAAGAGVALIAAEAFRDRETVLALQEVLEAQEPWSEMPVILFGNSVEDEASRATELLGDRAQIVFLERPLGIATFVTATEAALRSRKRQYEVKRLLDELATSASEIARAHVDANRAKDEFIATVAHELRSPMTAIRGWIQMLKVGALDPKETASALSMIEASIRVQSHIIEDLMDVSRILAGKVMIEPSVIELSPVIDNVVATFRPAAAQQGIELTAVTPPETLLVWGDDARLQQVGWNLVSNAIKFTPAGGSVRVLLDREGDRAVIRVRDTGQGLSPELLPHVFERYRQAEGGANGKGKGGLGLGLAIVLHLVEGHSGTVQAFSEGTGRGAEFVVSLPLHTPAEPIS